MIWWPILLLAIPTALKVIVDLSEIKDKKGVAHKTELEEIIILSFIMALIVAGIPTKYPYWVRLIQSGVMSFAIFFQFFDWAMGIFLHGNPLYTGKGKDAAKTDEFFRTLGPIETTFLRLTVSSIAISCWFFMDKIIG